MRVSIPGAATLVGASALLMACASEPGNRVEESSSSERPTLPQAETTRPASPAPPVNYREFTAEQLFRAITGELSAQRGDLQQAAEIYFELATESRDEAAIERAVQFSSAIGDSRKLLELGLLWAQIAPDIPEPHLLLAFQLLEAGRPGQALAHMEQVLETGGEFEFNILATVAAGGENSRRGELIAGLRSITERYPQNRSARLALVQLLAQDRQFEAALAAFEPLRESAPPTPDMARLRAQLHQSLNDGESALEALREGVEQFPAASDLRLAYARMLIQRREMEAAREQFAILLEQSPRDWDTWLSAGLLDLETANYPSAIEVFEHLLAVGHNPDDSHFYLGYANQQLENTEAAIEHFRQVRQGVENFLPAQQQATRLAIQSGQFEDAHDWLAQLSGRSSRLEIQFLAMESAILLQEGHPDRARQLLDNSLNRFPNHAELLFARVFVYDAVGDMAGTEADLQTIIRLQPDNARALNHLGYMLADRTERHEEALELIERAIAIEPEDPAIIDSLGWAQYKVGFLNQALENLRRAYAAFPNHEVAAHLGEVLWMLDRREEAERVWNEALAENPASEYVLPTMERLKGQP